MENLSIQELRQALRERGANSRGSKGQLMSRYKELLGFQSGGSNGSGSAGAAKVRVTIQKNRNSACMLLVEPSQSAEQIRLLLLTKAANKFQFRPTHLYVISANNSVNGIELTTDNLSEHMRDGLTVLASTSAKTPMMPPASSASPIPLHQQQDVDPTMNLINLAADSHRPSASSAQHSSSEAKDQCTDSGSCSSTDELEAELAERASIKSFDSDSLYSFHSAAPAPPTMGYEDYSHGAAASSSSSSASAHHHLHPLPQRRKKGWGWMLPQAGYQTEQQPRPSHLTPAFVPTQPHQHRNHRCTGAADSTHPRVPSLMDEITQAAGAPNDPTPHCRCCDEGCEIDFSSSVPSTAPATPAPSVSSSAPPPATFLRANSTPAPVSASSPSPTPATAALTTAASSATSSTHPTHAPHLSHSQSQHSSLSIEQARIHELERANKRLDASLKNYLRSDTELRARVAALSQGQNILPELQEEFAAVKLANEMHVKDASKLVWERDRLKAKNKLLCDKNNELKLDSEALVALKKEFSTLQQAHARLSGQNVNASTSPAVLQELLLHHTQAIQRVHQQMAANVQREKKELTEARLCKVCLSRPSDTILLPCSHFVLCGHCASSINKCPICRSHAADKRPVYM